MGISKTILVSMMILYSFLSSAQIRLPALISDHMILQQNSQAILWGWARPGEKITILPSWSKKPVIAVANSAGKWTATVKTIKAGGPYTLQFSASDSVQVKDVLLGEVWLASGQSNMEFKLKKHKSAEANYPLIRMIDVPNRTAEEEQAEFKGKWSICSPETAADMSAVAYFFSRDIHKETGFPVGIINASWGGTPAESWTKKQVLESDTNLQPILMQYEKQVAAYPEALARYKASLEKWKADTSAVKGKEPAAPGALGSHQSPSRLYNGMIAPLIPYSIKGVLWYQGESNASKGFQYRYLFSSMIKSWRSDWKNDRLPFYFVQISPHQSQNPDLRESQFVTYRTVPYTGIVVTTDNGDSLDIHPPDKEPVGKRLALWALYNEYGKKSVVASGPLYKSMKVEGNKIRIEFDYADGLIAREGALTDFTISGSDQQFRPAEAVIEKNSILVSNLDVKEPVAVRFAWRNVPHPNLYNKAGLPASPFRTDNWKLQTEGRK
ncbi:MAG: sialate O-acetylesterase [Chitinophagaceae bacterium]|nr:sialate O-acetylesterase [Chitinophagaceae bacterium]